MDSSECKSAIKRVVQYSQIDSIGVSGDSNGSIGESERVLCGWLIERGMSIIIVSAFLLGVKANLFCTNRAIGMTSFSISTNPAIGLTNKSYPFVYIGHEWSLCHGVMSLNELRIFARFFSFQRWINQDKHNQMHI